MRVLIGDCGSGCTLNLRFQSLVKLRFVAITDGHIQFDKGRRTFLNNMKQF